MVWPLFGNMEFHRSSILVSKSHKRKNFLAETTYYGSKDNRKSVFSGRGEKRGGWEVKKGEEREKKGKEKEGTANPRSLRDEYSCHPHNE